MVKTVFLTGGTGLLGGHLGREFLARGWHVLYLARGKRLDSAESRVVTILDALDPDWRSLPGTYDVLEGDITLPNLGVDEEKWGETLKKVDEFWHSAAVLYFSEEQREVTEKINYQGTLNVLDFIKRHGIKRLQHISTAYVSGLLAGPAKEKVQPSSWEFRNPYEETKHGGEMAVWDFARENGVRTTIYRPAVIVGDSKTGACLSFTGFYNIGKVFALMKRLVMRQIKGDAENLRKHGIYAEGDLVRFPLRFPCSSTSTINLIPVDCVVSNIMSLCELPEAVGQVYHLTHHDPPRTWDLLVRGCRWAQISGVELVDCPLEEAEEVFRQEIAKFAECGINISFCLEIREYLSYIFSHPVFDVTGIRETLKDKYFEAPAIDEAFLRRILDYAAGKQWHSLI